MFLVYSTISSPGKGVYWTDTKTGIIYFSFSLCIVSVIWVAFVGFSPGRNWLHFQFSSEVSVGLGMLHTKLNRNSQSLSFQSPSWSMWTQSSAAVLPFGSSSFQSWKLIQLLSVGSYEGRCKQDEILTFPDVCLQIASLMVVTYLIKKLVTYCMNEQLGI